MKFYIYKPCHNSAVKQKAEICKSCAYKKTHLHLSVKCAAAGLQVSHTVHQPDSSN